MAESNSTVAPQAKKQLSKKDLEHIGAEIVQAASLIYSILGIARETAIGHSAAVEALCEKAGFIADRCAVALGEIPVCGDWESWARVNPEPEAREAA